MLFSQIWLSRVILDPLISLWRNNFLGYSNVKIYNAKKNRLVTNKVLKNFVVKMRGKMSKIKFK